LVVTTVAGLLAAILPTCLYLYVEPRGRRHWAFSGDSPAARRAPPLVRATGWLSFGVGQLAVPVLLVPVGCAILLYLQTKLGVARPIGLVATAGLGLGALVLSLMAFRLLPLGVRLLSRDARLAKRLVRIAAWNRAASGSVLGASGLLSLAMTAIPSFVHPWLRVALAWTALRPVMAYAAVCLLHSLLLGRCARALTEGR
jgi:hypothetical protein